MDEMILEPLKYYESYAADAHRENVVAHFEDLIKISGLDVEENRRTVRDRAAKLTAIETPKNQLGKIKFLKVLTIIMAVLLAPLLGLGIFLGIYLFKKKLNPKAERLEEEIKKLQEEADALLAQAKAQTAPLCALFRNDDTFRLMEKTVPIWRFYDNFSNALLNELIYDCDYRPRWQITESALEVIPGRMCGNPFLFERIKCMNMRDQTYTGALTISWSEAYFDSKGHLCHRRRTQTLHASVVRPKPHYTAQTSLGFGSPAAPDLKFSRQPSHTEDLSESQLRRKIRRGEKKLKKKAEQALADGKTFQDMANSEFDVLFGALDRDHELQFRLLYTPLAQQNTVDLLTSETGYGDDFAFYKQKRFNKICSEHAAKWSITPQISLYSSHDVDVIRRAFTSYNEEYFKSVYFDLAPLMAIPVYQEEPLGYRAREDVKNGGTFPYAPAEYEALANALDPQHFRHPRASTEMILKATLLSANENSSTVRITSHSYEGIPRTELVPTWGGDGHLHAVPVHWIEYCPLEYTRVLSVTRSELNGGTRFHGLQANLID